MMLKRYLAGSAFQVFAMAIGKARLRMDDSLKVTTTSEAAIIKLLYSFLRSIVFVKATYLFIYYRKVYTEYTQ